MPGRIVDEGRGGAGSTSEERERIDAGKVETIDAERGHEPASPRTARGFTEAPGGRGEGARHPGVSRQTERGAPRLDTPPTAAYLHAIGGELTITVTAGNSRFVSGACRSPTSDRPLDTGNGGS
ncbi:hypothetical protein ACPCJT_24475 [Streptomyces griseoincarnatus]